MIRYADIPSSWINKFITLHSYENQTDAILQLQKQGTYYGYDLDVLFTLTKCSNFTTSLNSGRTPPLAGWWLNERSKPFRDQVLTHLSLEPNPDATGDIPFTPEIGIHTMSDRIRFIQQLTMFPTTVFSNDKIVVNGNCGVSRHEPPLKISDVERTVRIWLPAHADELLHCLSYLWSLHNYRDVFSLFKDDIVAQRMLVFQGQKPGPNECQEIQQLASDLEDYDDLPMPWSLYVELQLEPSQIMHAEYAREKGMAQLSMPDELLDNGRLTP